MQCSKKNSSLNQSLIGTESWKICILYSHLRIAHVSSKVDFKVDFFVLVGKKIDEFERDFQKTRENVLQMK